ncbi:purine-nucleoside phosphorylase [bacterium]|nr:purine-nucleoside phosphorylase [bacterium]
MIEKLQAAAAFVKQQFGEDVPKLALILGSGLGSFPATVDIVAELPYSSIPNHPVSTVVGHEGKLLLAADKKSGKRFLIMQGRVHFYEGYSMSEVVFPVRMFALLGVKTLIVTNAAGGVNPSFEAGELMVIEDHLNMMGTNPLIGVNFQELGTRFPDMSIPYSKRLIDMIRSVAMKSDISLRSGVYAGMTGPSFETPSEIKMLGILGASAVGMSTVPEVIVANHAGMEVGGVSFISNKGSGLSDNPLSHEEVGLAAKEVEPLFAHLMNGIVTVLLEED